MKSIKAIAAGSLFIIVVILFLQLAFIFIAVAYHALAKDYAFLNDISGYFRYLIGIPVFMVIMFVGGYITANIATVSTVDVNVVGSYTVTYNVSDAATNAAIEVTRTVNVTANNLPVITLTGSATINFNEGDVLVIYSDGIVEAANNKYDLYSEERLEKVLKKYSGKTSKEIAQLILQDVMQFSTSESLYQDDKTLVVIKRKDNNESS